MDNNEITEERLSGDTQGLMTKKDGVCSIIFFLSHMIMIYLFGLLIFKTDIYLVLSRNFKSQSLFRLLFYIPNSIIQILPIFLILKYRKQRIVTIGIKKEKFWKSILIGVIGSIPFSILNIIGPISKGRTLNPNILDNLWTFLYFFICIGFTEELVFRGFLQSRIQGLIKKKWIRTILVGVLFGLMRIPFQMVKVNMSILEFVQYDLSHLINTSIIHIYLVFLYNRDNNILAPTIAHAIMNFSYAIFI